MIELKAYAGFVSARLPLVLAGCELRARPPVRITSLSPFPGHTDALSEALGGFPDAGEVTGADALRLVWAGRNLAVAFGEGLPDGLEVHCALTDQSDGWFGLELRGKGSEAFLARRLPFDLRKLPTPGSAKTLLGHVPVLIVRLACDTFEIWTWRSVADSALHTLAPV